MKLQKEWVFTHQCEFKSHLFHYSPLSLDTYLTFGALIYLLSFLLNIKHLPDRIIKLNELYAC